jgi:hypothetical protein
MGAKAISGEHIHDETNNGGGYVRLAETTDGEGGNGITMLLMCTGE